MNNIEFSRRELRELSMLGPSGCLGKFFLTRLSSDSPSSIICLVADSCTFSGLGGVSRKYPDSVINVGIAEQNLLGVAGGLAANGFNPFVSGYSSFLSLRSADQVKVVMAYMNLPVKLIGLTSGYAVSSLGPTHLCLEDLSLMCSFPNIMVLSPSDGVSIMSILALAEKTTSPVYIRMPGTLNLPIIYKNRFEAVLGGSNRLKEGEEIEILSYGSMIETSLKVAEKLEKAGVSVGLTDVYSLRPLDTRRLASLAHLSYIVIIEEHSVFGGLGSLVEDFYGSFCHRPKILKFGHSGNYPHAASYSATLHQMGLSPDIIANKVMKELKHEQ